MITLDFRTLTRSPHSRTVGCFKQYEGKQYKCTATNVAVHLHRQVFFLLLSFISFIYFILTFFFLLSFFFLIFCF